MLNYPDEECFGFESLCKSIPTMQLGYPQEHKVASRNLRYSSSIPAPAGTWIHPELNHFLQLHSVPPNSSLLIGKIKKSRATRYLPHMQAAETVIKFSFNSLLGRPMNSTLKVSFHKLHLHAKGSTLSYHTAASMNLIKLHLETIQIPCLALPCAEGHSRTLLL